MKNIIFLAPPAAGKGTCSDILKNTYDCKHISTGAILRSEIASQSSLGKEIKKIIDAGKLVSDDYMIKLIEETLSKLDKPFILDGFPRTINQAKNLSILFDKLNISNYIVIYLNIDKELALKRTLGRVTCDKCGRSYNIFFDLNQKLKEYVMIVKLRLLSEVMIMKKVLKYVLILMFKILYL